MKHDARLVYWFSLAFLLAACGRPTPVGLVTPPTISIAAPVSGQQVQLGQQLEILFTATDALGVARVELGVDGVLLNTLHNSSPAANVPFSAQQIWTASTPGSHALMAVAFNSAGVASSPVVVNFTVVDTGSAPPPPPPSATPASGEAMPTATWTPISIVAQASPTTSPPSPTTPPPSPTATSQPPSSGGTRPSSPGAITGFEEFGTWKRGDQPNGTFTQSSEQVHGGANAGKLAYNFSSGGNDFVVFLQTHLLGGRPNQISAWVYGDGSKHYLNVWVRDAAGETWQFPLGQVRHSGWQQMSARLDPTAAWPAGHIDGPSNGVLDYPVDFRALVLDDIPDTFTGSGTIYLDDLRCDETSAPTPTPTGRAADVSFRADEYTITQGKCTWLRWDVENVRAVYLNGEGVVGHDQRQICPATTTTYKLRVVRLDGTEQIFEITITVVAP